MLSIIALGLIGWGNPAYARGSADDLCKMPKPTQINVKPSTQEVLLITNRSLAEMQSFESNTVNPHGFGSGISVTQGLAKGQINTKAEVRLNYLTYPRLGVACIWYESIDISLDIDPHVYIAKEVHRDRCMGAAVLEHEMKHVNVDRAIVNRYANIMGQKIYGELQQRGFMAGPVRAEEAEAVAERMKRTVLQIVEIENKRMELDRADMQAAVDTAEEYQRVANMCPDFRMTPEMLGQGHNHRSGNRAARSSRSSRR
ncbi:MAG: hypothetical protein ACK4VI_01230 [Alphaproteobacteria bacterium]